MTERPPLQWYDAAPDIGIDGKLPCCAACCDLLLSPGFIEAVYSVSIEHPGDPAELAERTINHYHDSKHLQ